MGTEPYKYTNVRQKKAARGYIRRIGGIFDDDKNEIHIKIGFS